MINNTTYKTGMMALLLFFTTAGQISKAQETKNLSMDEAVQLSLQNSKQLKLSQAKVDESNAGLKQAKENRLPDLKASGSYLRVNNPTVDLKVKLGSSSGSKSAPPTINQASYGMVNASIPLFSGLRIQYGIESARYLDKATILDADRDRDGVIQNTIAAYVNLYKSKAAVNLMNENLKQSKQRVTDFSNLEQNGLIARNDLLKVQLQESNIELSLLDAENNWKIAMINMNLMLGFPENTVIDIDTNSLMQPTDINGKLDWEQTALMHRQDLAAMSLREKAANSGIKAAKGEYFPSFALSGGYIALDVPNFLTVTNAINAGIGLQYNVGSLWKTGSKVAQAKARKQQIVANEEMMTDQVRLQVNKAYENYVLSIKKIEVYAKAVEQATENYRITKNKYTNNLVTTTDLLDADIAQLQARLNYTNAKADAVVAYKNLLQTSGIINQQYSKK